MADNSHYAQLQPYALSGSGAVTGATSITLKSMLDITGAALTMSGTFGTIGYGTLEPGDGSFEEQISFTGLTNNSNGTVTLTGVKTVSFVYPYTETSGLAKTHPGSSVFIISNTSGFYNQFTNKNDDETIANTWTFTSPNYPKMDTASVAPVADAEFATKKYVDDTAIAGSPKATDSVYGISKLSVTAVDPVIPIVVGDNDTRVPTQNENNALVGNNTDIAVGTGNKYVTQTGLQHNAEKYAADAEANDTYVITLSPVPTSYTNGMVVYFKANTANTGAATINVNGLGAKTIVKYVSTTLADGDIAAGMFCTLIYDGTNFVLQNPIANTVSDYLPVIGATTATALDASNTSTTTITHNLGVIPRFIRVTAVRSGTSPNNFDTISTGIATINNSNGAIIASYVSMNAGDSSYESYYNGTNIAGVAGTGGANLFAPLSSITSTQMSITFAAVGFGSIQPGGTMTYIWEVSR